MAELLALLLAGALVLPVAVLVALMGRLYVYGFRREEVPSDVAIVLGAAIRGERPSPVFRERINHGIRLLKTGKVKWLLLTGGLGDEVRLAEAEVARRYALSRGVPAERILLEAESRTTFENMAFARGVMKRHGLRTALIVSDPIHMMRSIRMARDNGIEAHPAPTPTTRYRSWRKKLWFVAKEAWRYWGYLMRGY